MAPYTYEALPGKHETLPSAIKPKADAARNIILEDKRKQQLRTQIVTHQD